MAFDKNIIRHNAEKIVRTMKAGYRYTLAKLQEITTFGTTELCLALLMLIQEKKVEQFQSTDGVRYALLC